jgi:antitoxin component YwqK of YwqJK toxin-antitoxin module
MRKALIIAAAAFLAVFALLGLSHYVANLRRAEADARSEAPAPILQPRQNVKVKELVERYEDGSRKAIHLVMESNPLVREGLSREYYKSGKLRSETNYIANEASGKFAFYSEDGSLAMEGTLKNGLRDGRFTEWHPDGRVKIECGYKNGHLDGSWSEYYDADGSPKKLEAHYSYGALTGRYVLYKIDGLIKEERHYGQLPQQEGSDTNFDNTAKQQPAPPAPPHDCSDTPLGAPSQKQP